MPEIPGSASRGNTSSRNDAQEPGCPQALRSRVPHGTPRLTPRTRRTRLTRLTWPASVRPRQLQPTLQDRQRRVVIAVEDEPAARTDVRAHAERLPDARSARSPIGQGAAAVLGGVFWWNRHHWDPVQPTIVLHPAPQTR